MYTVHLICCGAERISYSKKMQKNILAASNVNDVHFILIGCVHTVRSFFGVEYQQAPIERFFQPGNLRVLPGRR